MFKNMSTVPEFLQGEFGGSRVGGDSEQINGAAREVEEWLDRVITERGIEGDSIGAKVAKSGLGVRFLGFSDV